MATFTWRGSSADWSALSAWAPVGLPGSNDVVAAALQVGSTIAVSGANAIGSVFLSGTTIALSGTLSVTDTLDAPISFLPGGVLHGGTLVASGLTNAVLDGVTWSGGVLNSGTISNGTSLTGTVATLNVVGTGTGYGNISFSGGANVAAGATFDATVAFTGGFFFQGDGTLILRGNSAAPATQFNNGGFQVGTLVNAGSLLLERDTLSGEQTSLWLLSSTIHNTGLLEIARAKVTDVAFNGFPPPGTTFTNDGTVQLDLGAIVSYSLQNYPYRYYSDDTAWLSLTDGRSVTNNGSIIVSAGGTFDVANAPSFVNTGAISVHQTGIYTSPTSPYFNSLLVLAQGGTLAVSAGTFSNTGTIALGTGASFTLDASTALVDLQRIDFAAGTLALSGTLDLDGAEFSIADSAFFASIRLNGEYLRDGAYRPATLNEAITGFNHVALHGDFGIGGELILGAGNSFHRADGAPGQVNLVESRLILTDAGSIDNLVLTNAGSAIAQDMVITAASGGMIGPGTTILSRSTTALSISGDGLVIAGIVASDVPAARASLSGVNNQGIIDLSAFAGATIGDFINGGTLVDQSSQIAVTGTLGGGGLITLGDFGALSVAAIADDGSGGNTIRFTDATGLASLPGTGTIAATLDNFRPGDALDLSGLPFAAGTIAFASAGVLVVSGTGGTASLAVSNLLPGQLFAAASDGAGGTLVTAIPCFAAGTRIRTRTGECRVELLRPGDRVASAFGGFVPVIWVGRRQVDATSHPTPQAVWPIRFRLGALGDAVPARELRLSPEHAVHLDGRLIPARCLVNGVSIVQEQVDAITYWHVELPQHDVLLAEGAPCESYLDTGNRADFDDAATLSAPPGSADEIWRANACAPQCRGGPRLAAVRARLAAFSRTACRTAA